VNSQKMVIFCATCLLQSEAETCALCVMAEKESAVNTRVPRASTLLIVGSARSIKLEGKACDFMEGMILTVFSQGRKPRTHDLPHHSRYRRKGESE
jgi:hypothetical protein